MLDFTADAQTLKELERVGIVHFEGLSGEPTTAEVATQAPTLVQVRAKSGKVLSMSDNNDGSYRLKESKRCTSCFHTVAK